MANTTNECSGLVINYEVAKEFDEILNMQAFLQEKIQPGFYDSMESIASIGKFFLANKHAMEDEMGETLDALGGIHDGKGSAAWKWWKKDNKGIMSKLLSLIYLKEILSN